MRTSRIHTSLVGALQIIANAARENSRPLPVISTDISSAFTLRNILAADLGCRINELMPAPGKTDGEVVMMFDGVKIVAPALKLCKHEVDGWREHFGPLAEIWS